MSETREGLNALESKRLQIQRFIKKKENTILFTKDGPVLDASMQRNIDPDEYIEEINRQNH